jgi:protein-disulfide isomerase
MNAATGTCGRWRCTGYAAGRSADYYMVAILDRPGRDYSSRAGAAAYCVADQSIDTFRSFHAALYAHQPAEAAASFPDNAALIDTARQAGAGDAAVDCINNGTYTAMVAGMAEATNVTHTPTVRINGQCIPVLGAMS